MNHVQRLTPGAIFIAHRFHIDQQTFIRFIGHALNNIPTFGAVEVLGQTDGAQLQSRRFFQKNDMSGQVLWVSKNGDFVAVSGFSCFFQYDVTSSFVGMRYTFVIEVSSSIYGMENLMGRLPD